MMKLPRKARLGITLTSLLFSLCACQPRTPAMTEQEAQQVNDWTNQRAPVCLGRMVLDLPRAFVLNTQSETTIDGVRIKVKPQARADFDSQLTRYREQLAATFLPGRNAPARPYLRSTLPLPEGSAAAGLIFDRSESDVSSARMNRILELHAWRDGYRIESSIKATDTSFPEDQDDPLTGQFKNDVAEKLAFLVTITSRVRGREPHELPAQAGTCIANGFVSGPASDSETVQLAFHLEGTRDVYFNFVSHTDLREKQSLLERSAKVEREMKASGTSTVRKGTHSVHGQAWEEWLFKGPTPAHVDGTMFNALANEKTGSPQKPYMAFDLFNGFTIPHPPLSLEESAQWPKLTRATLSEAQAVALWDVVLPTLRKRPGAF